jgi:hypothetical protein
MHLPSTFARLWQHLDRRSALRPRRRPRRPRLELLEDRTMPSVSLGGIPNWVPEGPAPQMSAGNVDAPTAATKLDDGAVEALAVDPSNSKHVFAGSPNGGIWQTADFTAPNPIWTTTTDLMPSLSISSIAFSPVSSNVIYAGTGQYSSDGAGGLAVGVYKSIDGGATWQIENPNGIFSGLRILRIIPTTLNGGQTVFLATTDTNGAGTGGVYRSDTGGTSWTRLSGGASGLPDSGVTDLVENPNNANQFFAATSNSVAGANAGVYELDVTGGNTNWANVTNNIVAGDLSSSLRIELAISPASANPVWASIINPGGFYQRVYRGVASGATINWAPVGPVSFGVNQPPDLYFGNQGGLHGAIAADPSDGTLVYLSGDTTGTDGNAGYIARGDSTANTWTALVPRNTGNSVANVTSVSLNANVATLAVTLPPNNFALQVGQTVVVAGLTNALFNGTFLITNVITNGSGTITGISYALTGPNLAATADTGTATVADRDPGTVKPTDNGDTTAPHSDSRAMVFASGGVILYSCDGGVYQCTNPRSTTMGAQVWTYVGGATTSATVTGMQVSEMYDIAYDSFFHIILGGDQDTGNPSQTAPGSFLYTDESGGDGGATATDPFTLAGMGESARIIFSAVRKLYNGPASRVPGDHDASILPQTGLAGLTSGLPNTNPNDLFIGSVVNAIGPTPAQIAAGQATRVVVAGKANGATPGAVYESNNVASSTETQIGTGWFVNDTWTLIPVETGTGFTSVNQITANTASDAVMAYGGRQGGLDNPDVLYVASGSKIFLRSTAGGTLKATAAQPAGAGSITAIALDPNNWQTAFVADNNGNVYMTTNMGASWIPIKGNLTNRGALNSRLAVIPGSGNTAVLFGGSGGVFRMLTSAPGVWTKFGAGLPNALTGGMVYNAADDVLVVGTHGRGAWELPNASTFAFTQGVLEIDGDTDFPGENDTIKLVLDPGNPALLDVFLNSTTPVFQAPIALLNQINVNGLGGNNTLIVDSSNGLINVPNGINYDGGTGGGFNTLQLVQTGGTTQTSDNYSVGPNTGQGIDTITGPGGTQTVFFSDLAPVTDLVPATTLTVNGTASDNAINYSVGSSTSRGLVAIDNFEPIEFANKTNLAIISGAGSDTVNINNPNTPTGLTGITATGGSPTNFHTLVVNGVAATVGVNTGTGSIAGGTGAGGAVPISYNTFSSLVVNAGAGTTTLALSGSNSYVTTPATASDGGTVQTDSIPVSFTGLGSGKTLSLTGLSGASLVVNGTTGNDAFTVDGSGNIAFAGRATIAPTTIASLTINGIGGSDTFSVTGPQTYTSITLAGGGPAASQVATVTSDGATAMAANLGGTTASVTGGGFAGPVSLPDIGVLNLNAGGGAIALAGTSPGPNAFSVTPTGASTATAQVGTLAPVVNTTNTGSLTVSGVSGGSDSLAVDGTSSPDTIGVTGSSVAVNALKVVNYANIAALQVNGLAGPNTFNVTSSATVPISINGGDPTGATPGDQLNVVTGPTDTVAFTPGATSTQGTVVVNSNQAITFAQVTGLGVNGAGTAVINDTTGSDTVTVTARDSSYAAGADGVQDFTVAVNAGPNFLFLNTPSLVINSLAGNDEIALKAPAPNLAAWSENVSVVVTPAPAVGNQLTVTALGTDQATYAPASAGAGSMGISNSNGTVANLALTNIASLVYDGQAGGDRLTMVGTSAANAFVLKPGAANDAGTLSMDSTLPVSFQNLGTAGQVVVNGNGGADALTYYGTAANDTFTVSSPSAGTGQVNLNARVPLLTTAVQTLTLEGVAGDDTFTQVQTIAAGPYTTLNLHGGPPATPAGSQANLTAAAATAPLVLSGQVVTQGGKTVAGSGLANENLNGALNDLTYNSVGSVTENINVIASPTAKQGQVSSPGVALWSFTNVPIVYVNNANAADSDTVTFTGTNNSNTWHINLAAAGTDADPVLKLQDAAAVNTLLTLGNYTGFQALNIAGLSGADAFNVFVSPVTTIPGRQLFIDAEPATGKKLTNVMTVFYAKPRPKIVHTTSTQDPDQGLVSADYGTGQGSFLIQFDGIPKVDIQQQ